MPDTDVREPVDSSSEQFSPQLMNETWDLSNRSYADILMKQREIETARIKSIEVLRSGRSVLQRILDNLLPV